MNKKGITIFCICLSVAAAAYAQSRDGGITPDMLGTMRKAHGALPSAKAVFNAMASNRIDDIAVNFANQGTVDTYLVTRHRHRASTTRKAPDAAGCSRDSTC